MEEAEHDNELCRTRTIKFRVWYPEFRFSKIGKDGKIERDDTGKEIVYEESRFDYNPIINNQGVLDVEGSEIWGNSDEEYVLEQFTGLKDVNGREVYAGDVIETTRKIGYHVPKGSRMWVMFDEVELCFWLCKKDCNPYSKKDVRKVLRVTSGKPIRVIGNIHENGELLEDKR